jgi:hypothetical protein
LIDVIQKAGAQLKTKTSGEMIQHRYSFLLGFNLLFPSVTTLTEQQQSERVEEFRHMLQKEVLKMIHW